MIATNTTSLVLPYNLHTGTNNFMSMHTEYNQTIPQISYINNTVMYGMKYLLKILP